MQITSDILLIAGTFGLAIYCGILSRRLRKLARSDIGLGATIATLSDQVAVLTRAAEKAASDAEDVGKRLSALNHEAERHEGELAFLIAGLEDLGSQAQETPQLQSAVEPVFSRRAVGVV